jgi:hypothetical protein
MFLVGSAVLALLLVIVFLLYKAGQRVTTSSKASNGPGASPNTVDRTPPETPNVKQIEVLKAPPAEAPPAEIVRTVPTTNPGAAPSRPSMAGAPVPRAKPSGPSTDIFRKPAF